MDYFAADPLLGLAHGGGEEGPADLLDLGAPLGQTVPGQHPVLAALVTPSVTISISQQITHQHTILPIPLVNTQYNTSNLPLFIIIFSMHVYSYF